MNEETIPIEPGLYRFEGSICGFPWANDLLWVKIKNLPWLKNNPHYWYTDGDNQIGIGFDPSLAKGTWTKLVSYEA